MERLAIAMLVATVLAGCSSNAGEPPGAFEVRIVHDERSTFYAGDEVELQATALGQPVVAWEWDLGDGTRATGSAVRHVYETAGPVVVTVVGTRDDGAQGAAQATLEILDLFGGVAPGTGAVDLSLAAQEPVTGEPFTLRLDGPAGASGTISVWVGQERRDFAFDALPASFAWQALEAGRHSMSWMAEVDGDPASGAFEFDVWGRPRDFGEPSAGQWLRPGTHSSVCTTNFLFHYKWYRFFIGSAAHCVDDLDIDEVCRAEPRGAIGKKETLSAHDSAKATQDVWVAYESWLTMHRVKERGAGVCAGNDFALLELGPKAQELMHPAALFYGGPTALAPVAGYGTGTTLYGYGASALHGNVGVGYPGQEAVNRKVGISLGADNSGYSQHLLFALPGVPGDSGGPAFGPAGEALGAASTITVAPTPGTNRYTNVPKALAYMEQHEGWAPELIPYAEWSITGT